MWILLFIQMYPHFWPRLIFVVGLRNVDTEETGKISRSYIVLLNGKNGVIFNIRICAI